MGRDEHIRRVQGLANMERILTIRGLKIETPKRKESEEPAVASFVAWTFTLGRSGGSAAAPGGTQVTEVSSGTRGGGIAKQANSAKQTVIEKVENLKRGDPEDE